MGRITKTIDLKNQQSHIPFILVAVAFAFAIFFSKIGVAALNPLNDQWLMAAGSDWTPDYMAWGFYRNADWSFPLGMFTGYSFPEQVSIGLTGAIPLLAVPLKILNPILPDTFQHFGVWLLLCYVLQAIFSYNLLNLWGTKDKWLLALGSCFFVISYTLLDRIAHTNLCGHWEILAGLCVYFGASHKHAWWKHGLLIFASIWTHPYLVVFTVSIAWADYIKLGITNKEKWLKIALYFLSSLAFAMAAWFLIGNHILESDQARGEGFGVFSANLNTFFTPKTDGGIMPALPRYYETQFEGVAYLGIGILISLLFLPILIFKNKVNLPSLNRFKWPLLTLAIGMFIFSWSNQVCLNDRLLIYYKLPEWAMDKAAILRASGRYVWLIYYLILGSFVYIISNLKIDKKYKYAWLAIVLLINIADFWPQIKPSPYTYKIHPIVENFQYDFWNDVIAQAEDFIMYPAHHRNYNSYADDMAFAEIAMKNKRIFNSGHLARFNSKLRDNYKAGIQDTLETKAELFALKTIITSKEYLPDFSKLVKAGNHDILEANNYYAFIPKNGNYRNEHKTLNTEFQRDTVNLSKEQFGVYTQRNKNNYLIFAVMDEASSKLNSCEDFVQFINNAKSKLLNLNFRESYIGIVKDDEMIYESFGRDSENSIVQLDTVLQFQDNKKLIEIFSADKNNGNEARIFVGGKNYAVNDRGLNIVSINEQGAVEESTHFDTFQQCHHQSEKSELYYVIWKRK